MTPGVKQQENDDEQTIRRNADQVSILDGMDFASYRVRHAVEQNLGSDVTDASLIRMIVKMAPSGSRLADHLLARSVFDVGPRHLNVP